MAAETDNGILERVLTALYDDGETPDAIRRVLAVLGEYFGASRTFVFEDSPDGAECSCTFEWCAADAEPLAGRLHRVPYVYEDGENVCYRPFDGAGVLYCPDASALPAGSRGALVPADVRATLRCSLLDGGRRFGLIGCDECREHRSWTEGQVQTLSLTSKLVSTFLSKTRHAERAVFSQDYLAALDGCSLFVMLVNPRTHEILFRNRAFRGSVPDAGGDNAACYRLLRGADGPCEVCPMSGGQPIELRWPDGRWMLAQSSPLRWRGEEIRMLVFADISRQKRAEAALRERNAENAIVIRQSGKNVLRYDLVSREAYHYGEGAALMGLPEMIGNYPDSLILRGTVPPESCDKLLAFCADMRRGVPEGGVNLRLRTAAGVLRWFHADYTLIFSEAGLPSQSIISFYDNTEVREKELAYDKLQRDLKAVIAESDTYQEVDLTTNAIEHTEGLVAARLRPDADGTTLSEEIRRIADQVVCREDRAEFLDFFSRERLIALYESGKREDSREFRVRVDEQVRWYAVSVSMIKYPYTENIKAFIVCTDIDESHRERERLERLAQRDSMTQLLNHSTTEHQIRRTLEAARPDESSALFMIDIDNFKSVNDTMGHQAGDAALRRIAEVLAASFRSEDILGRFGGDEFLCFLPGITAEKAAEKAAGLTGALRLSFGSVRVSASVGIAMCMGGEKSFEQLYGEADDAMYRVKTAGKGHFSLYDEPRQR